MTIYFVDFAAKKVINKVIVLVEVLPEPVLPEHTDRGIALKEVIDMFFKKI